MTDHASKIETSFAAYLLHVLTDVVVDGAGNVNANGDYAVSGFYNNRPYYISGDVTFDSDNPFNSTGTGNFIYWDGGAWQIYVLASGGSLYNALDAVVSPGMVALWNSPVPGQDPAPSVTFDNVQPLIVTAESDATKNDQVIIVIPDDSEEEDPPFTGNVRTSVRIELKTPTKKTERFAQHNAMEVLVEQALQVTDLDSLLMSEQDDFTVFGTWNFRMIHDHVANYWMSGYQLTIYSCGRSFPN